MPKISRSQSDVTKDHLRDIVSEHLVVVSLYFLVNFTPWKCYLKWNNEFHSQNFRVRMEPPDSLQGPSLSESRKTRASSTRPFIGHSRPDVPPQGLASIEDVLKVISCKREEPKAQKKPVKQMCCIYNKDREARCLHPGGCLEKSDPCLLLKVKRKYLQAGIKTVSDRTIIDKLEREQEKYRDIYIKRDRMTPAAIESRENYLVYVKQTFDIKDHNARLVIENDPDRSDEAKAEDLAFFDDFLGK